MAIFPFVVAVAVAVAVAAGVDTHQRLPLDVLNGVASAAFVTMGVLFVLVLMRRIPAVRRRIDRRSR